MIYNLSRQEFETISGQLFLEEELNNLFLDDLDLDEFIIQPSSQKFTTFEKKNSQLFIKIREGIFKNLL